MGVSALESAKASCEPTLVLGGLFGKVRLLKDRSLLKDQQRFFFSSVVFFNYLGEKVFVAVIWRYTFSNENYLEVEKP